MLGDVVTNLGQWLQNMCVVMVKTIIQLVVREPETQNEWYGRLYQIHKRVKIMLHSNYYVRTLAVKQTTPILNALLETGNEEVVQEQFRILGNQPVNRKKRTVLILAAGMGVRWEPSHLKQLAIVDGKPIIENILTQIPEAIVVSHHRALHRYPHVVPSRHFFVLETILSTISLWKSRTIILLGDTTYGEDDLKQIMEYDGDFAIFGSKTQVEIFAISFTPKAKTELLHHLAVALLEAYQGGRGKIMDMYRSYDQIPIYRVGFGEHFYHLKNTTDIDSYQEYQQLLRRSGFKKRFAETKEKNTNKTSKD